MNVMAEQRIAMESSQCLLAHLKQYAVVVVSTVGSDDQTQWVIFSGTLLQIGNRVLVATVAHALGDPNPDHYWILSDQLSEENRRVTPIRVGRVETEPPDVGFLEIDTKTLSLLPRKTPCPLNRIRIVKDICENRLVSVLGAPFALAKTLSLPEGRILAAQVLCYSTSTVPFAELKNLDTDPPLDRSMDILLEYPADAEATIQLDTRLEVALPKPKGMSGGGLWDQNFEPRLWSPNNAVLTGIQTGWFEASQYLRAVQIVHWLRLVHKAYEDLRPLLEDNYSASLRKE